MKYYAVVDIDGKVKVKTRKRLMYTSQKRAEQGCTADGDSVVEVYIDLGVAPLFILKKTM